MKRILYPSIGVLAVIALLTLNLQSNTSGGPASSSGGYTGGPAENGRTCGEQGGCHNVTADVEDEIIQLAIPDSGYAPSETYPISIAASRSGVSKWGFQLSVQDSEGNYLGSFEATDPGTRLAPANNNYIGHNSGGTSGNDSKEWSVNWTAPAQGSGELTFYAVVNASNSNGSTSGDNIIKGSKTIQEQEGNDPTNTFDLAAITSVIQTPNGIQLNNPHTEQLSVSVFSAAGQLLSSSFTTNAQENIQIDSKGLVLVAISSGNQKVVSKFLF